MSSLDIILPRFFTNLGKYRYTPKSPLCQRIFPICGRIFFKDDSPSFHPRFRLDTIGFHKAQNYRLSRREYAGIACCKIFHHFFFLYRYADSPYIFSRFCIFFEKMATMSYGGAFMSKKKFNFSVNGKGYYIALVLCAAAIGISGYLYYRNNSKDPDVSLDNPPASNLPVNADDVQTTVTDPDKELPSDPGLRYGNLELQSHDPGLACSQRH